MVQMNTGREILIGSSRDPEFGTTPTFGTGGTAVELWRVKVLLGQGKSMQEAIRQINVMVQIYYRWRRVPGGMSREQLKRLTGIPF